MRWVKVLVDGSQEASETWTRKEADSWQGSRAVASLVEGWNSDFLLGSGLHQDGSRGLAEKVARV